jgi:surfeit locus 1 family protein
VSSIIRFWLVTVLALLAVVATLSLGRWQLNRAAEKISFQSSIDSQAERPQLSGQALAALSDPALGLNRQVILRGHWLAQGTVFLDNRQMNSKAGLYVVTPLRLQEEGGMVLVQRGWVARNFLDRTLVPDIATPSELVEVSGRIVPPPSKLFEFAGEDGGRIRQNLDLLKFSAELGVALLPVTVQQTGAASDGVLREWPQVATGVDKHYGYAFQWFALSALIAILYVWFQIVKRFIFPRCG